MSHPIRALAFAAVTMLIAVSLKAQTPMSLPSESGQFDFWIGEWDVNLRVRQDDASWKDMYRAVARIYPMLEGKAILELWDEASIKGFSLRYYDAGRKEWVLWLNWPAANRSGSSSLAGTFRHGRGDFFSTYTTQDGTEGISRYSFNDITATSLRWDDAYSTDAGKTWSHNWIMEFSRTGDIPRLPENGGPAHTYHGGDRCPRSEFSWYEFVIGRRSGSVRIDGASTPATLTGFRILDGCAALMLVEWQRSGVATSRLAHVTFNTILDRFEILDLTSAPGTPARVYYGSLDENGVLVAVERAEDGGATRSRLEQSGDGLRWAFDHRSPSGEWVLAWQGQF